MKEDDMLEEEEEVDLKSADYFFADVDQYMDLDYADSLVLVQPVKVHVRVGDGMPLLGSIDVAEIMMCHLVTNHLY
ncbi:uncharacterized protein A4U43_C04F17980 [Asparagus officinalis]|uniref:Uncharacterized protein n=1 Tax=Asparagus officinalis TaxID=4686 RepID=A0A5P1F1S2_ASPOF|nr:uncharacterized protein A4U43_C04F17980 [Asparagus officinalis]